MSGGTESVPLIQWLVQLVVETATAESLVAIGLGLVAGIIVVLLTRREKASDDFDSELTDLEERKEHAVAQLRELEAQRDKMDPQAYADQRAEHERVAVEALRTRDQLLKKRRRTEPPGLLHERPGLRAAAWGGGIVVALGLTGWIVSPDETPSARPFVARTPTPAPAVSPELAEVLAELQRNPTNVDALVRGAAILSSTRRLDEASQYIDRALQLDPEHPEALAQYAALLAASGKPAKALARLDVLVEKHPDLLEAWSLRGMLAMEAGDAEKARASFDEYMKRAPDGPGKERIRALVQGSPAAPNQDEPTPKSTP